MAILSSEYWQARFEQLHNAQINKSEDFFKRVEQMYQNKARWAKAAMINSASMGKFSSDRAIEDYAHHIWNLKSCEIKSEK